MKKSLKIIAVNGGFIFTGLVVAELIFGSWIFGPDYSVLNIPRNTTRHFDVSEVYPSDGLVTYTRDEHGLRGKYGKPADIDVLVMGGSTTNEPYVSDGETWVDWLSKGFADAGTPLTIVNAAVDGQSTVGHIRAIDLWFPNIPGLKPRYVLFYVGINDRAVTEDKISRYDEMKSPDPVRRFRYYFLNNSVLYNRFRQIRGMFVAQRTRLIHGAYKTANLIWRPAILITDKKTEMVPPGRLKAYENRLRVLARKIKEDMRAEPIFITQRSGIYKIENGQILARSSKEAEAPSTGSYLRLMEYNRATLSVCRELGLTCVDLASEITFEDGDFYDHIHTSPTGSKRIGEFLYPKLKDVLN
ncbi:MAG: SGNH/GDSL hydrolase family protein [Rhodospirillales bacterium]|nr:SGNH/GDSL hydrolase family protein [Rhodospirillales bacterium]